MNQDKRREEIASALYDLAGSVGNIARKEHADRLAELLVPKIVTEPADYVPRPVDKMTPDPAWQAVNDPRHCTPTPHQRACESAWLDTLEHFKAPRPSKNLSYNEMVAIADSIKKNGAAMTQAALVGRRFEEKTQTFDPSNHLGLRRTFEPALFDKFVNLAAKKKASMKW